jgi:SAM-dependent methyltransferase
VYAGTIEEAPYPPARFDVVSFVHVIEHVPDPLRSLRRAYDLLVPGGLLFLLTPNAGAATFRLFRERWYPLDAPRHVNLFTPGALGEVCRRAGFRLRTFQVHQRPKDILYSLKRSGPLAAAAARSRAGRLGVRIAARTLAWFLRSGDELRLVAAKPWEPAAAEVGPREAGEGRPAEVQQI